GCLLACAEGWCAFMQDFVPDRHDSPLSRLDGSVSLRGAYVAAARMWPRISLSYEQFQTHLTSLGYPCVGVPTYPSDVYLCAACAQGQYVAYQALEAAHFPALRTAVQHLVRRTLTVDDVLQEVRTRLFLGSSPKIATYRGSGTLSAWLRKVAVNASQDQLRS